MIWTSRTHGRALRDAILALSCLATLSACGATCDRNPDRTPERYSDGITNASRTFYMTSEADGEFLKFSSGTSYRLIHGLSDKPQLWQTYLAFSAHPLEENGSGLSEGAGNQAVVEGVTDEYLEIRNDTCSDFYLRVTAQTQSSIAPAQLGPDGG